ncbi:unnamed protein product [Bubo scandiacus]
MAVDFAGLTKPPPSEARHKSSFTPACLRGCKTGRGKAYPPKSNGNAALEGFIAWMTSTEAGICVQLHTPTLTIPVDPGPGPDLIQIHINPQPFQWGYGDVRSEFGQLRWLSCGRKNVVFSYRIFKSVLDFYLHKSSLSPSQEH